MELNELQKVANSNKICEDAEKLRDKVAHASKRIIKLNIAQDTAYWDQKQRLRQVESNNEKLQQNMVELQMQYEAVSSQYQEELRLRPETLNKLASNQAMIAVLEEYIEGLRATLGRCNAELDAIYASFKKSGQVVRDLKAQLILSDDKNRQAIESLEDKLKMSKEHNAQMQEIFSNEKQRSDAQLIELSSKLSGMVSQRDEMVAARNDLEKKLEQSARDAEKKQETIVSLQKDIKQIIQEFHCQADEMKNINLKLEKDIKEATSSNEALKQALANQEAFTKDVCDQKNQMLEKVAGLEEEKAATGDVVKDMEAKLEILPAAQAEIANLKEQLSIMDTKNNYLTNTLDNKEKAMAAKVQQLMTFGQEAEHKINVIKIALEECRDAAIEKIEQLMTKIQGQEEEISAKSATVNQLTTELNQVTEERRMLETDFESVKKEMESQNEAAGERERVLTSKLEMLDGAVKNKDAELAKQMNVIIELRNDKDRLREKIEQMQVKFDNVQKELTSGPAQRTPRVTPEQDDDNAVMMLTPHREQNPPELPVQRSMRPKKNTTVYNFNEDSSDGSMLDPDEVNRRFGAFCRGEPFSPLPPRGIKRPRPVTPVPRALNVKAAGAKKAAKNDVCNFFSGCANFVQEVMSMTNAKPKERKFFKSKRN